MGGGGWFNPSSMDMACIPSIFIKTSQFFFDESCLISAFTKIFFGKLRTLKLGPRGRWKRASIFQTSQPSKKSSTTSGYALNLKALIKVSKVSWRSQLPYEILRSSFERKFDKTNFISPKKLLPGHSGLRGLTLIYCYVAGCIKK